jgi:Domain of unknown function DUF29
VKPQKHYLSPMPLNTALYDRDFYAWTNEQAELLRTGHLDQADIPNIAEEIESMGRSQKSEMVNRLAVLLVHLLKWKYNADKTGDSWIYTIVEQRLRLDDLLQDNPSLKAELGEAVSRAYRLGAVRAGRETRSPPEAYPPACPWEIAQILAKGWMP